MTTQHPTTTDAPSWVQADAACRHAWQQDRQWRKRARGALHEVHKDQLSQQAQRAYAQAGGGSPEAGARHHHAAECPCNPCRRRRGEKALPSLKEQQERRKRSIGAPAGTVGYEPGDRDQWLLSQTEQVRWTRVVDAERDAKDKITTCELRPEWLGHLDKLLRRDLLDQLWQSQPHLARAFCGHALDGRTQQDVAQAEGVSRQTIGKRVQQARAFLAERVGACRHA